MLRKKGREITQDNPKCTILDLWTHKLKKEPEEILKCLKVVCMCYTAQNFFLK